MKEIKVSSCVETYILLTFLLSNNLVKLIE